MKFLFENYPYREDLINGFVPEWMIRQSSDSNSVTLPFVGYTFLKKANEIVFFLPKIFVFENGLAFGSITPEDLLSKNDLRQLNNELLSKRMYSLSLWIYESIKKYRLTLKDTELNPFRTELAKYIIDYKKGKFSHTIMELYLGLIDFFRENRNIFIRKKIDSSAGHNINWHRTVSRVSPFIQDEIPFYITQRTKLSRIDFEEELLCIYFSVLNYFKTVYKCKIQIDPRYKILRGHQFERFLDGKGIRLLNKLKGKYFSDTFVKLWKLLYDFFNYYSNISLSKDYEESLVTNNYPKVFESMVDSLIGDSTTEIPRYYKEQRDGKIVDHIYRDTDLFSKSEIYFIGDSKYYSIGRSATGESVSKQFTYAKNVIQYSINSELNGYSVHSQNKTRYRDELTEGYNITPNFFISAVIDKDYDAARDNIQISGKPDFQCQFKNRLFDRDTLAIQRYSINFLFVLSAYISLDDYVKESFKKRARKKFRKDIINYINDRYVLFKVYHNNESSNEKIVTRNFKQYSGQMYAFQDENRYIIIAFDIEYLKKQNDDCKNADLKGFLKKELTDLPDVDHVEEFLLNQE